MISDNPEVYETLNQKTEKKKIERISNNRKSHTIVLLREVFEK